MKNLLILMAFFWSACVIADGSITGKTNCGKYSCVKVTTTNATEALTYQVSCGGGVLYTNTVSAPYSVVYVSTNGGPSSCSPGDIDKVVGQIGSSVDEGCSHGLTWPATGTAVGNQCIAVTIPSAAFVVSDGTYTQNPSVQFIYCDGKSTANGCKTNSKSYIKLGSGQYAL